MAKTASGSVLYPEIAKRNKQAEEADGGALLKTRLPRPNLPEEDPAPGSRAAYTGVIIDARGRNVERGMSPKIRRTDGSEVWGTLSVSPDFVIENGIAAYAHSVAEARKKRRVGSNPLVIRAQGRYVRKIQDRLPADRRRRGTSAFRRRQRQFPFRNFG